MASAAASLPKLRLRMTKYVKPYILALEFSNRYVTARVWHTPSKKLAASASTKEELLRKELPKTGDVAAAAKIGEVLAHRLKEKEIPGVVFQLGKGERYHGKRKALLDNLRENGIKFI
ncbi:hypothetical protein O6H91_06G140900 [Diphasiastrum complanatum]|uniref:Uncharacterized protein n=2 Tax=Diphasiastrum complanatum TaxID=34168 RepID=A0ACC2DJ82_DIPCM|nr:hypothetical protein O6H91_06G140100 [Diphasiastrum complanatum]KAJ7554449.1 hypothetical protein O6H91_06G140900 [Diphasiastrum complanatum]